MDKLLYVAMSGAKSVMSRQATNNNNLANVNTTGFREDLDTLISFEAPGQRLPARVYVDVSQAGINFETGQLINTGRDLDIAIEGDGLLAVMNADGGEAYTRAGNLRVTPSGILETADGLAVIGNNGPITISPYEKLEIAQDGTISIVPLGDTSGQLAVLDRLKLVKPDATELQRNEDGTLGLRPQLTRTTTITADAEGNVSRQERLDAKAPAATADGNVGIVSGALETSNVNPARALINMVELSRLYEMQMKMIKTAEQNDAAVDRLVAL